MCGRLSWDRVPSSREPEYLTPMTSTSSAHIDSQPSIFFFSSCFLSIFSLVSLTISFLSRPADPDWPLPKRRGKKERKRKKTEFIRIHVECEPVSSSQPVSTSDNLHQLAPTLPYSPGSTGIHLNRLAPVNSIQPRSELVCCNKL